jgi:hypothetical protein
MTMTNKKVIELAGHLAAKKSLLERVEPALPPGDPIAKVHALLERDDAATYLPTLNPHSLFRLVKEAGWDQGMDLVPYASPEQFQIFVDLDCWKRDAIVPKKMEAWLAVLVADAEDEQFKRVMRELDPEVLGIFFKTNFEVDLVVDGEIPDHIEGPVSLSPDGVYALVYPEDEDTAALMRALLDRLYELDRVLAWTLLEAVRWELMSEMEESAYRWRMARLEEHGFASVEESLQVYTYRNPVHYRDRVDAREFTTKPGVETFSISDLPTVITEQLDEDFYFFEVLRRVPADERLYALLTELATLNNRTLIADGVEPGELDSGQEVVRRTVGYLSLGLEFLSRHDLERARELVEHLPLREVFQVGFSLARKLQLKATALARRPTLSLVEGIPFSLLNPDEEALFEALQRPRPTFAWDTYTHDIFKTQAQLDSAALRIGMIAFKQLWLFGVARQDLDSLANLLYDPNVLNEPVEVSFDVLFQTMLATFMVSGRPELRPLALEELQRLPELIKPRPWVEDPVAFFEPIIGPILVALPQATATLSTRWLQEVLKRLHDELGQITAIDDPVFFTSLFVLSHR